MKYLRLFEDIMYKKYIIVEINQKAGIGNNSSLHLLAVLNEYDVPISYEENGESKTMLKPFMEVKPLYTCVDGNLKDRKNDRDAPVRIPVQNFIILDEFDNAEEAEEHYMVLIEARKYNL